MGLLSIFHTLWIILSCQQRKIFHLYCVFVIMVFCSFIFALCFDVNSPDKEEYLLKSHKVIEALPRALNQPNPSAISTALMADGVKAASDPCSDPKSYEAIRMLHRQLDDDASGDIDVSESDEFLRDELQYENGYERHRDFHGNDKFISVDELWQVWKVSQVHNWTVEETVLWFLSSVELPEYEHSFRNNGVDGTCLPRMAINSNSLLSGKLGIKDPIHRQKIALKAMDVVLFGAPKYHNYIKDAILAASLIVAICGCWFAYVQHKYSQTHMQKMMRDMEVLQRAEEALSVMQQELNKAKQQQEMVNIEKLDLERRLQNEMKTSSKSHSKMVGGGSDRHRLRELEEQLRNAQSSLHDAEMRLDARSWVAPPTLQHWLQLTHELELRNYNKKKVVAESQLLAAKEGCEKLRKKRTTFMGAFRIAHGASIDDVDDRIMQARTALSEVTTDLQERMHRWKQIEKMCGVPIIQNLGMTYLEAVLKPPTVNGSVPSGVIPLTRSNSEGTLLREESPPPYAAGISSPILPNIPPPPRYSKTSPSYNRKLSCTIPPKSLLNNNNNNSNNNNNNNHQQKPLGCTDNACPNILEAATEEEDDKLLDLEEEFTERSATPVSCSSQSGHSDAGKASFNHSDRPVDLGIESQISADSSADTFHSEPDRHSLCHLEHLSGGGESADAVRKISTGALEEKKKKKKNMSSFVASLKSNFGSSNISEQEATSSEPPASAEEKHRKEKKLLFPHLRRKKAKIL